ncbi:MAG TPA: flagellar filament capping protein FliD [Candidatus Treponema faecavium]|nr:flagellar filament capping protein FliD [Candidatus Treponema faecavium]
MADINIPGVSDKYNTSEIVANLMKIERIPLEREQKALEDYEFQQTAWRSLNQKMVTLRETCRNLYSFDNPFNNKISSSTQEDAITVEAGRNADLQSFQIEVLQPASADRFLSHALERSQEVPAGLYEFTVGDKTAAVNWRGGNIQAFADALNKRSNGLVKASLIGVSGSTQALMIESLKTGAENRLIFGDTAQQFAIDIGMLQKAEPQEIVFGASEQELTDAAPVTADQTGLPALSKDRVSLSAHGITVPPRSAFTIPVPENIAKDANQQLSFTFVEQPVQDITEEINAQRQQSAPVFSLSGQIEYRGIVITNELSDAGISAANIPRQQQPVVPVTSDAYLWAANADGTETPIDITHYQTNADGIKTITIDIADYPDIAGITIRNANTATAVALSPVTASNPAQALGVEPVNAVSTAADAKLKYEGIAISRATNDIDDIVPDVTLHVHSATERPATITIDPDTETAKDAIIAFVGYYNQLLGEINILTQRSPEIVSELNYLDESEQEDAQKRLGIFSADFSLTNGKSALQTIISNVYPSNDMADIISLAQMGISTSASGSSGYSASRLRGYLEIDEQALDAALENNMADVKNVFGYDSDGDLIIDTGVAYLADQRLQAYVQSNGILSTKTANLDRRIETSRNTIQRLESQLADREAQLKQQYGQMEATLNSLESQQDSITNFSRQQQNNR